MREDYLSVTNVVERKMLLDFMPPPARAAFAAEYPEPVPLEPVQGVLEGDGQPLAFPVAPPAPKLDPGEMEDEEMLC